MADKPNTYIRLYFSNLSQLEKLSYEQVGRLTVGIMKYKSRGEPLDFDDDQLLSVVAEGILGRVEEDFRSYERICAKARENGKNGGAPKGNKNALKKTTETTDRLNSTHINKEIRKQENKKENNIISSSTSVDKKPPFDYQAVIDCFNSVCVSLPKVQKLTDKRRKAIKSAAALLDKITFAELFSIVENSDFLTGRKSEWSCGFDWILKPANLTKIIEGNYDNGRATGTQKIEYSEEW